MSSLFVIGSGPLRQAGARQFSGGALRTMHFVEALRGAGHRVALSVLPHANPAMPPGRRAVAERCHYDGQPYWCCATNVPEQILPFLQEQLADAGAHAVVAVNPMPAARACGLQTALPLWADLNGYGLVEGQTHARVHGDDGRLHQFWRNEMAVIRRADRFSTASTPHRYAVLGELALVGRMNRWTFDHDFVTAMPEVACDHFVRLGQRRIDAPPAGGAGFQVLWCGSYNTWCDVETLFHGLEGAMAAVPDLTFVSTGGAIAGHDEKTYGAFQALVAQSPHRERYRLLGWVEPDEVDRLLMTCHVGVNVDSRNYDTVFGARHRLTTMAACALPVITTVGTEVSRDFQRGAVGWFISIGDAAGLTEALIDAATGRQELERLGRETRRFLMETYGPERIFRPFLDWAAAPSHSPDHQERLRQAPSPAGAQLTQTPLNAVEAEQALLEQAPVTRLLADQGDLQAIRSGRAYRWWKRVQGWLRSGRAVWRDGGHR